MGFKKSLQALLLGAAITAPAMAQEPTRAELLHLRDTRRVEQPRVLHSNGVVDTVTYNPARVNDEYIIDVTPDGHVHATNGAASRIKDGKFNVASLEGKTAYMTGEACRGEHRPISKYIFHEDCAPIALYFRPGGVKKTAANVSTPKNQEPQVVQAPQPVPQPIAPPIYITPEPKTPVDSVETLPPIEEAQTAENTTQPQTNAQRGLVEVRPEHVKIGASALFLANSNSTNADVAHEYGIGAAIDAELFTRSKHALAGLDISAGYTQSHREGEYTFNQDEITRKFLKGKAHLFVGKGIGLYASAGGTVDITDEDIWINGEEPSVLTRNITTKSGRWTAGAGLGKPTNHVYAGLTNELTERQAIGGNLKGIEAGYEYLGTLDGKSQDFTVHVRKLKGEGVTLTEGDVELTRSLSDNLRITVGGEYRQHEIPGINKSTNLTARIGGKIAF